MNSITSQLGEQKRTRTSPVLCGFLGLLLLSCPRLNYGQKTSLEGHGEPLGSLSSVGEVNVNDSPAPAESTVFAGDRVHTGVTGVAIFTRSGSGTLKIAPESQVVISGGYEYTAELEAGTAVLHSISGGKEMTLRMGNYVLIPSVREESTTSRVERTPDGSFLVSCLDGSIGVLTLAGSSGQFLQTGQSVRVFPNSAAVTDVGSRSPAKSAFALELPHKKGWTLLGLAGAGAGAIALELSQSGGKQSVSPAAP